jgi:hypothetical protein
MVYSRAERVFILEHYFALKPSAAVREAFTNVYPDKEAPNKTTPTGNKVSGHRKCLRQEKCPASTVLAGYTARNVKKIQKKNNCLFYTDVTKVYKYCC